jgi:carbon-monoxide dehydrogenase medium subunit
MKPFEYLEAKTIEEACSLLSRYKGKAKVIAGGTDLYIAMKGREITPEYIIDLKTIPNLDYIRYANGEGLKIGALATLDDIEGSPIIREKFSVIAGTIKQMAVPAIRNMGTIGGNLCNAAPSADTAPPLMGLGAKVKIAGVKGERIVALEEFFLGPSESTLEIDEILTEVQIADLPTHSRGVYLKLEPRNAVDIALVGGSRDYYTGFQTGQYS